MYTTTVYADEQVTGECGEEVAYTFDPDQHLLTVYGTGAMYDWEPLETDESPFVFRELDIQKVVVEEGVETIGAYAFAGNTGLQQIELPDSLRAIESHAFHQCTSLQEVRLPGHLQRLEWAAFCECSALTSISLPDTLSNLGAAVLDHCPSLTTITLEQSNTDGIITVENPSGDQVTPSEENTVTFFLQDGVLYCQYQDTKQICLVKYPAKKGKEHISHCRHCRRNLL